MAATEPVTPRRTLATYALLVQDFDGVQEACGQVGAVNALVLSTDRPQEGPGRRSLQGIGHDELRSGLAPRSFRNVQKPLVADTDFQFKLGEDSMKAPLFPDKIDQLGRADQAQPKLRLVASDFLSRAIQEGRCVRPRTLPAGIFGAKVRVGVRSINTGRLVVTHRGTMNEDIKRARRQALRQTIAQVCKRAIGLNPPAFLGA